MGLIDPSPLALAAAVETARRHGWDEDDITLAGWIAVNARKIATLRDLCQRALAMAGTDDINQEDYAAMMREAHALGFQVGDLWR